MKKEREGERWARQGVHAERNVSNGSCGAYTRGCGKEEHEARGRIDGWNKNERANEELAFRSRLKRKKKKKRSVFYTLCQKRFVYVVKTTEIPMYRKED
jgi:hypothetical protein